MKSLRGYMANYSPMSYEDVDMAHLNYEEENTPKNYLERIRELIENGDVGGYVSAFDRGFSGGFGRKVGGFINAVGSYPVDRMAEWLGYENVPSFNDRYNEIVQTADANEAQLREQHPYSAMGTEMLGNVFGLGSAAYNMAGRMGLQGAARLGGTGAMDAMVNTFGQANNINDALYDMPQNITYGAVSGAAMGKLGEYGGRYANKVLDWGQNRWHTAMNNRMQTAMNQSVGHRVDIPQAVAGRQQAYDKYIADNANREVLDFGNSNMYGRQDLVNQLASGNYSDIPFGTVQENIRQQVNQIRVNSGEVPLDANMMIPRGVVQKWGGNRMNENYSPERVAKIADEVFHSPDVKVSEGSYPHIQKLMKERQGHSNDFYGFISRDKTTGQTTVKTVYEKGRGPAGRQPASLQNKNSVGRMRLSDLQTSPYYRNLLYENVVVNRNLPNVSGLYNGLTPSQVGLMDNALRQGLGQSAHKAGTLDSLDKIRHASYQQSGAPTDLSQVQNRINKVMKPHTGHVDSKLAQAKRMEQYYRQGYQNQAITYSTGGQQFHSNLEKQAYLQGQLDRLAQSGQTAQEVLNNQALLQQLMPDYGYNRLYSQAQRLNDNYQSVLDLRARYARHLQDLYNRSMPHAANSIIQKKR